MQTEERVGVPYEIEKLLHRYWDAYLVARTTDKIGGYIKQIAIVFAVIMALLSFLAGGLLGSGGSGGSGIAGVAGSAISLIGVFLAVVFGIVIYLFGILVSAQGQVLKATLDTAVNSSPFLSDYQKFKTMSVAKPDNIRFVVDSTP